MKRRLGHMTTWIDKAEAHAASKGYEPSPLEARRAPDDVPLPPVPERLGQRHVRRCVHHRQGAAVHPDTEQTFAEIGARIASVVDYLGTFTAGDIEGLDAREVKRPRWEGRSMRASDYLLEQATPNFFFHFTMAYALLRHNGVDLGKRDYIGKLSFRAPA